MKKIYLEPQWKLPVFARYLLSHPPVGYEFVAKEGASVAATEAAARHDIAYKLYDLMGKVVPINLGKAWLDQFAKPPKDTVLTWAILHPVFRREPWIIELARELPHFLVGHEPQFERYKSVLLRLVKSDYCRRIICCDAIAREALLSRLGTSCLEDKIEEVERAVPSQEFTKNYSNDKVRLLFVNSVNIRTDVHFFTKGGAILVEAFSRLSGRYPDLELVIRSALPPDMKAKCKETRGITLVEQPLPAGEFERLWQSADIFVLPTHVTPDAIFIEAMSYELPVVSTNVWANPGIVQDGRAGLLIDDPVTAEFAEGAVIHFEHPGWRQAIRRVNEGMVEQLVDKLRILIENPELRRQMGRAGRWEVEHGKFSMHRRNEKLKRILDEVTS